MPEMPEVLTVGYQLAELLKCSFQTPVPGYSTKLREKGEFHLHSIEESSPSKLLKDRGWQKLVGSNLSLVTQKGKYLLLKPDSLGLNLYIHRGMTGGLSLTPGPFSRLKLSFKSAERTVDLYFNDVRKFGRVGTDMGDIESRLGPSPFEVSNQHVEAWLKRRGRSFLRDLLTEQEDVSGVGNYLINEAFWILKVHPKTKVSHVSRDGFFEVMWTLQDLISRSSASKGVSISDYFDLFGNLGTFQNHLLCYRKKICARCGGKIIRVEWGDTGHYTCESCSPEPT